jgi:hypothetical protein
VENSLRCGGLTGARRRQREFQMKRVEPEEPAVETVAAEAVAPLTTTCERRFRVWMEAI